MAIYAWPGLEAKITAARFAPIWIEHRYAEIRRHWSEPKPTKKTKKIEPQVSWLVKLETADGHVLRQGKWQEMHHLRADEGIKELHDTFAGLVGTDEMAKFEQWNKSADLAATDLWPLVGKKEVD